MTRQKPIRGPAACTDCRSELDDTLSRKRLGVRYRPLADLRHGTIFGHLASAHGPADTSLASASRLLAVAGNHGMLPALAASFAEAAIAGFADSRAEGLLLLPLPVAAVAADDAGDLAGLLFALLKRTYLPCARVLPVFHGAEDAAPGAESALRGLIATLKSAGMPVASALWDCGHGATARWSDIGHDWLLLDERLLDGLDMSLLAQTPLAGAVAREIAAGGEVIACGIAGADAVRALAAIGVAGGAGDFIGRASTLPVGAISAAASRVLLEFRGGAPAAESRSQRVLEKLLMPVPPIAPDVIADAVFALFERERGLRAVAVVRDGRPVGLISRYDMVDNMARPYRHELYGRKPCTRFMDAEPLIADIGLSLHEISEMMVQAHPRHMVSGFIITDRGVYAGMGSVQELVREVTGMQIESAKYANPLTHLPGNVPINDTIDAMLSAGEAATICWCDLDHFKPFNDVYGYARGDDVIRLTARVLEGVCDPERDFIGHIGGDDFILAFRSPDWRDRCERALDRFGREILGFFSPDDIERGGYVTENRKGKLEFHGLTTLSIGAVDCPPGTFRNHLDIAAVASEVKRRAKAIAGNSLYVNQRTYA